MSTVRRGVEDWLLWKRTYETVRGAVISEVSGAAGISEPELTVLVHLHDAAGPLRQNVLAASTGWDRGRLSHLLTRMEAREYLQRTKLRNGVELTIRSAGQAVIDAAWPSLERAVAQHLTGKLSTGEMQALRETFDKLLED